jgi:hypothetical protein
VARVEALDGVSELAVSVSYTAAVLAGAVVALALMTLGG